MSDGKHIADAKIKTQPVGNEGHSLQFNLYRTCLLL